MTEVRSAVSPSKAGDAVATVSPSSAAPLRTAAKRGRGERAGITRQHIIEAARDLDPAALTMQAVAERLGVKRSALNYHISDRDELLHLVAADAYEETMLSSLDVTGLDWPEAVRAYAATIRDAVLSTGHLVDYFRYRPPSAGAALDGVEQFLSVMTRAGFSVELAGRTLQLLSDYAMAYAKDVIMAAGGAHPQQREVLTMLTNDAADAHPQVRELMALGGALYDSTQFDFTVQTVIAGLRSQLQNPA